MSFDKINNGTHGRYPVPVGMVINVSPFDTDSEVRATSSVSGLGSWGPTSTPVQIGPFGIFTEIVIEVTKGAALVEVIFPGSGAPVTVAGVGGVGNTLSAILAAGWTVTGYQWFGNGVAITGATQSTYTQQQSDANTVITLSVNGLTYTPGGILVSGGASSNLWVDTSTWFDTSIWVD